MANPVPVTYSAVVGEKVAGGRHSADLVLRYDIDTGNISHTHTLIKPRQVDAEIAIKVRKAHVHWLFQLDAARGRRPTIRVDESLGAYGHGPGWVPWWSPDLENWFPAQVAEQISSSPVGSRFKFPDAFTHQRVWVADKPAWTTGKYHALAQKLAADTSGRVAFSAAAPGSGVLMTSRAATTDYGSPGGGHSVYGFVLEDAALAPAMGVRKRELVLTSGIHAGEVETGWYLDGVLDYFLNGVGADADQFRREWKVIAYFSVNPNGRFCGISRSNTYGGKDPNRDWGGVDPWVLDESRAVRDAMLIDAPHHDAHFDYHSTPSTSPATIYKRLELPSGMYTAFKARFDAIDQYALTLGESIADGTISEYVTLQRAAKFVLVSEPGSLISRSTTRMREVGANYVRALMHIHTLGWIS